MYENFRITLYVISRDGGTKLLYDLPQTGRCRVRTDWTANNASRLLTKYLRAIKPVSKALDCASGSSEHHVAMVGTVLHCR